MKIAKTLKQVALLFLLLFPLLAQPTSALKYSTRFNTCAQMKKQYRFGVALSLKIAGDYPAKISKLIYVRNEGLDFDYDGIVCENELLQNNLNPKPIPATTTTTTTTPVVSPLPTSPQRLPFKTGQTATLRRGVTYLISICTDRAGAATYLDVLSLKTGWTQKATGILGIDTTNCNSPGYPYSVIWSWTVSESPGEVTSMRMREWNREMKVVITN